MAEDTAAHPRLTSPPLSRPIVREKQEDPRSEFSPVRGKGGDGRRGLSPLRGEENSRGRPSPASGRDRRVQASREVGDWLKVHG